VRLAAGCTLSRSTKSWWHHAELHSAGTVAEGGWWRAGSRGGQITQLPRTDGPRTTRCGWRREELNAMALPTLTPEQRQEALGKAAAARAARTLYRGCPGMPAHPRLSRPPHRRRQNSPRNHPLPQALRPRDLPDHHGPTRNRAVSGLTSRHQCRWPSSHDCRWGVPGFAPFQATGKQTVPTRRRGVTAQCVKICQSFSSRPAAGCRG
jgi:hypothetical protein